MKNCQGYYVSSQRRTQHPLSDLETVFDAGSISKQFTATAIMLLAEEGKLGPTDSTRNISRKRCLPEGRHDNDTF
jgi:hypothetical protein